MTHRSTPRIAQAVALAAALFAAPVAASAATALVLNNRDDGPGSFRHAIERANYNESIDTIQFLLTIRTVYLKSTVVYTGKQPLTIHGHGATIDGSLIVVPPDFEPSDPPTTDGVALAATGGGDLAISGLTIRKAPSEGLAMLIPEDATGTVRLWLFSVEVAGNKGHGVLVNDQLVPTTPDPPVTDPETPPIHPNPAGSAAGLEVTVLSSRFVGNGFGAIDRDGLRVNEGAEGDLRVAVRYSVAEDNGADGIEVDERGNGNVIVDMLGSRLGRNGSFSSADFDDGFDIDELDGGDILGQIVLSSANDNYEQGFDFNENDAGDLEVNMLLVEANDNSEEGIEYEEDDDFAGGGNIAATLLGIRANGNGANDGDAGLKLREKGEGDLTATLNGIETLQNLVSGVLLREDAAGSLLADVTAATSRGNADRGIDFDENAPSASEASEPAGGGNLTVALRNSTALDNVGLDLRADEGGAGAGTLTITNVTFGTNGGGVTPTITP